MAGRTTDFADGPRMLVFRAVEAMLRADPVLAARVKTWSTWDGSGNDAMPVASAQAPYLQLSPVMLPSEVQAVGRRVAVLGIRIRVAVSGLVAEDIVNFWDAVEDALTLNKLFQQTTVYCALGRLQCFSHRFETPGIDAWQTRDNPPNQFLEGAGLLVLRISRTA